MLRIPQKIQLHGIRYKHSGKVIAIRREDQSVWERRAPFAPHHVKRLVKKGVSVLVQPSNRRAYPMQSYLEAGAMIREDISDASVIFGVKQVPIDALIPEKTYCFFSHTIKAQESNMPLLDAILEKNIRLIDYERIIDESGQRQVAFGRYAGVAGMINILHGLGLRLLALGHHTPFTHIGPPHNYRNSSMARQAVRDCGYEIALGLMPRSIGPLTFIFTGSGNVSQGAKEVFQDLPIEYVAPETLRKVSEHGSQSKVYGCEVSRADHLERREGGGFDPQEYIEFPERYISTFSTKIAPYASVVVNGIYWAVGSPKLLTIPDAKTLLRPANTPWLPYSLGAPPLPHRMLAICDISADPGGSIEFMNECTNIDTPFCLYDADRNKDTKSFAGPGVLVCSIDNMPTQLPLESTDLFGDLLLPHTVDILQSDARKPLESHKFSFPVHSSIVASNGKLTENFEYIAELRESSIRNRNESSLDGRKQVLVLGAGMVCAPMLEYLYRDEKLSINVCSQFKDEADRIANKFPGIRSTYLNVTENPNHLAELCSNSDVVVSLLPYALHGLVAEKCIDVKTHMVTASYITDHVRSLHQAAKDAGVTLLNEVGLDPGIDHFLALEEIKNIHERGGFIESFISYCGGLPAPEHSNNPLRYKFSWSPRGVLANTLSPAKYLSRGQIVEILGGGDLMSAPKDLKFLPGFALEGFPNRDSTKYGELYGLGPNVSTLLRGTIRYKGFSECIQAIQTLGLIDTEPHPMLHPKGPEITWRQLIVNMLGLTDSTIFYENLKQRLAERIPQHGEFIERLGLLDETPVVKLNTPIDTLSDYLSKRLAFDDNERDLVILRHEFIVRWPDNTREEKGIDFVVYGTPAAQGGDSAMALTVGYPAAIATKMILDGEIQERGVVLPFAPDVFMPMLSRLRAEGFSSSHSSRMIN
ncbi:alpha-aminoadipic semialdehyde synthase, mitochondrial isoform X4 [Sitodiplosis mosellana]|uniref:alpha-aminoadipic semialdehyde synthase, mitochondrial isoform X4 n=1 Tax=Sitodiplosis mosellana TaxID=263140 RepID=UPI0024448B41|nr:alpha-aminoadipic semialdehyde synthase, mitochondrial isoform X4 [Sitodiplosis mosellana]